MTARSKRGSAIPGMARRSLPERKVGCSATPRPWSASFRRASLESAVRRAYLAVHQTSGDHP
jgi:hypothetical protein